MASPAYAADYYRHKYKLNGGVGDYGSYRRYYYITSSASSYSSLINNAMNDWIYTTDRLNYTTSISYRSTTTQKSSVMDIYASNVPSMQGYAYTYCMLYQKVVDPDVQNWGWNKIIINTAYFNNGDLSTSSIKKGTIAHEMGHCFGLAENNGNKNAIMCQFGSGRKVTSAQICDLKGINAIYG